jgi:hypothetical protein
MATSSARLLTLACFPNSSSPPTLSYASYRSRHRLLTVAARLCAVLLLGAVCVSAQVSSAPAPAEEMARWHGPAKDLVDHRDGTATSSNWSGYLLTGSGFTRAEGSWTVPAVTCTSGAKDQYSLFWVGLDGYVGSSTIEQTGTASNCSGTTPQYYAWYQFFPIRYSKSA